MDYRCIVCHENTRGKGYIKVTKSGLPTNNVICNRDGKEIGSDLQPGTYKMLIGLMPYVGI